MQIKKRRLTLSDRLVIEKLYNSGVKPKDIAEIIGFSFQTVYYELKKGYVQQIDSELREYTIYSAQYAHEKHKFLCSSRGTDIKLSNQHQLVEDLQNLIIKKKYSPYHALCELDCNFSLRTLYNYINKGYLEGVAVKQQKRRKKQFAKTAPLGMSISYRPEQINCRNTPFHWEIDTVIGSREKSAAFLVLTERLSRVELVYKLKDKSAASVSDIINKLSRKRDFKKVFHSFTCDNGREFAGLLNFNKIPVYFCHAYSSWERGSNENNNRFIRRFFPKGKSLDKVSQQQIIELLTYMNTYHRRLHNGRSAGDIFNSLSPVPIEKFYCLS